MVPDSNGYKIVLLDETRNFHDFAQATDNVSPLGFIIADLGDRPGYVKWLRRSGWQLVPFYYREKQIWRKSA